MYFIKQKKIFTAERLGYLLAGLVFLALALTGLGALFGWRMLTPFAAFAVDIGLSSLGTIGLSILTAIAGWLSLTFVHAMLSEKSVTHSWPGKQSAVTGIYKGYYRWQHSFYPCRELLM
jgi:membrane protein implicated in regulation of membrane protease activity